MRCHDRSLGKTHSIHKVEEELPGISGCHTKRSLGDGRTPPLIYTNTHARASSPTESPENAFKYLLSELCRSILNIESCAEKGNN